MLIKTSAGIIPGVLLCAAITLLATLVEIVEQRLVGEAYLEALVLAILLGVALRSAWKPGAVWAPGIKFSAKMLLEIAVVLLGASVSVRTVLAIGPGMLVGIAVIVVLAILSSYGISR